MQNPVGQKNVQFKLSTRHHVLVLLLIATLPVLGLILYNGNQDRHDARKFGRNQAMEVLRAIQFKQQNVVESTDQLLTALGQIPTIQNRNPVACRQLLYSMLEQYTQYISLAAFNSNGQLLCSSAQTTETLNIFNQPHVQQALSNKQLSSADYSISNSKKQPALAIAKPIINADNEIQTLLHAKVNLGWLEEHIQQLPLYSASLLTMFDKDGTVFFQHPAQSGAKTGHKYPQTELIKTAVKLKHLGVMERSDEHGTDLIHAYAPLNNRSLNTFISVSVPADVVMAKANHALQQNLILAALVTLSAIMIAFAWSHRLFVNPIRNLAEAATQVRQGKLNTQIENNNGPKELSQLGRTFNQMTTALQHRAEDQARIEHALSQLIQQHRDTSSAEFLVAVASILADTLEVDYCLIGLTGPDQHKKFYSCTFWGEGRQLDNISINTQATPHDELLEKERFRIYRNNVQQLFPGDPLLHDLNIKSYAGISLTDFSKTPCGLLVVMNNHPIKNDEMYHSLLQIFAARITVELEREQTERQRQQLLNETRLAATAFESHEGMFITDRERNILRVNRAFRKMTGHHESEVLGRQPDLLFSDSQTNDFSEKIWEYANEQMKWSGEAELNCKAGSPFPADLTISSVRGEGGEITHYVAHFHDISERKQSEAKIQHQAFHDALTNLPNRTLLLDRLETTLATLRRRDEYGALMFIDLDHFKHINDSLGHPVGDALLINIAERLKHSLRQEDSVARLGGDEFVVLLPQLNKDRQTSQHEAHGLARKLLRVLSEEYNIAGHTLKTSVSIGIAIFPDHNLDAHDILRHADLAMYSAKDSGRGSVKVFESEMQTRLIDRLKLENELKQAYEQDQFILYHQPQIKVETNTIIGSEVLLRWQHPEKGLLLPDEFISVMEESGLILTIGDWILDQACATLASSNIPIIAVNISPGQFAEKRFVDGIINLLNKYQLDGKRLELEITERIVIKDIDETIRKMNRLKDHGVRFSIDDFGTGYSSLAYIKQLPIDTLKIDRSFIQDCLTDNNDKAIVRAIISMAKSLELGIVAEGVETREQLNFLKMMNCPSYQGYYFSRPIPEDEFIALLQKPPARLFNN